MTDKDSSRSLDDCCQTIKTRKNQKTNKNSTRYPPMTPAMKIFLSLSAESRKTRREGVKQQKSPKHAYMCLAPKWVKQQRRLNVHHVIFVQPVPPSVNTVLKRKEKVINKGDCKRKAQNAEKSDQQKKSEPIMPSHDSIRKRRSSRDPEGSAIQWYICESIINLYSRRIKEKNVWPYSRPRFCSRRRALASPRQTARRIES
jgi:hypothetical protein